MLRVSAVQIKIVDGEPFHIIRERGFELAKEAIKSESDLIVFPEAFIGYATDNWEKAVEDLEGETTKNFIKLAKENGVHLIFGLLRKVSSGIANSAIVVGPDGIIGKYDKVHLCPKPKNSRINEPTMFIPGKSIGLFDTPLGKIGIMICYDGLHPELALSLTMKGSDFLVWLNNRPNLEEFEVRYQAKVNRIPIVAVNRVGTCTWGLPPETIRECFGKSIIVNEKGEILSSAKGGEETIVTAELDLESGKGHRQSQDGNPILSRRPDLYAQVLTSIIKK